MTRLQKELRKISDGKIPHEHRFNLAEGRAITGALTKDGKKTFFIYSECFDDECRAIRIFPKENFVRCTAAYIEKVKEILQTDEIVLAE